jgi:ABC-2 type transport system permease protein
VNRFAAAFWGEALKARRSRVPPITALGFSLAPFMGGVFMFIVKDPTRARAMGILRAKAQLAAGVADWPTYFTLLAQATAVGGLLVFGVATAWVFGREFADGTAKELLAVATPRRDVVIAKFVVVFGWGVVLSALVLGAGLVVGAAVGLPGWSRDVVSQGSRDVFVSGSLTLGLMPAVAFAASAGRGYLPAFGWTILTLFLAQVVAATGWGAWFPWSVPALYSGLAGPGTAQLGVHSYVGVALVLATGGAATIAWWEHADHAR